MALLFALWPTLASVSQKQTWITSSVDSGARIRCVPVGRGDAGLGPSIERWIVDRHHGKITMKSELGKKHDITVTLPTIEIPRQEA
jgi:signal transduction histidine kinase